MNKILKSFVAVLVLSLGLLASPVSAQVTLTSTRLTAAITSISATSMTVASGTGFTAGTTQAVIDGEQVNVTSVSGSAPNVVIGIVRGLNGTRATTHANAAVVYVGNPRYFDTVPRSGSCTAANEVVLPVVVPTLQRYYTCTGGNWVWATLSALGGYLTMPATSGGIATFYSCGTTAGNANCGNTQPGSTGHMFGGIANLSAGSAIISAISPTFTSTSTGFCTVIDTSPASGGSAKALVTGVSSITISGTNNQAVAYLCFGY